MTNVERIKRVNELLRREIGAALYHCMDVDAIDLAAVTITHVVTSRDLRHAQVMVSIREHHTERKSMLALLRRHRGDIQEYVHRKVVLKYTPRLSFTLDTSVERGDRILNLLSKMDIPPPDPEEGSAGREVNGEQ